MVKRWILLGPVLAAALLAGGCTLFGAEYKSETTEIKQDSGLEQRLNNLELRIDRIERKIDRLETRR
jgi:hypothetical protein